MAMTSLLGKGIALVVWFVTFSCYYFLALKQQVMLRTATTCVIPAPRLSTLQFRSHKKNMIDVSELHKIIFATQKLWNFRSRRLIPPWHQQQL